MLKNTISLEGFKLELNQFSLEEMKLIFEKCEDPQTVNDDIASL